MTGPRHDPADQRGPTEADQVVEELEQYAHATRALPPTDLADRIMAAVEQAPTPRRGMLGWMAALAAGRAPGHRWAKAGVMAATLVLAVGGIFAAGELARLVRDGTPVGTSPSPVVETLSPSPEPSPTPRVSPSASPTATPDASASESEASETPEASEEATQPPAATPSPSDEEHSSSPKATETPGSSDDSHSGPG